MDTCFKDVTIEFLSIAFHNILYYASVYPKNIFESRRKYGIVVYRSCHPDINTYIDSCLKSVSVCLEHGQLNRIDFAVTNNTYESLIKFVFEVNRNELFDETKDAYLVQAEQNLRAFCLSLTSATDKFKDLPEDCSFSIFIHTNESTAVTIASNAQLEVFPLVEVSETSKITDKILPLQRISIQNYHLDTYIEVKE